MLSRGSWPWHWHWAISAQSEIISPHCPHWSHSLCHSIPGPHWSPGSQAHLLFGQLDLFSKPTKKVCFTSPKKLEKGKFWIFEGVKKFSGANIGGKPPGRHHVIVLTDWGLWLVGQQWAWPLIGWCLLTRVCNYPSFVSQEPGAGSLLKLHLRPTLHCGREGELTLHSGQQGWSSG